MHKQTHCSVSRDALWMCKETTLSAADQPGKFHAYPCFSTCLTPSSQHKERSLPMLPRNTVQPLSNSTSHLFESWGEKETQQQTFQEEVQHTSALHTDA